MPFDGSLTRAEWCAGGGPWTLDRSKRLAVGLWAYWPYVERGGLSIRDLARGQDLLAASAQLSTDFGESEIGPVATYDGATEACHENTAFDNPPDVETVCSMFCWVRFPSTGVGGAVLKWGAGGSGTSGGGVGLGIGNTTMDNTGSNFLVLHENRAWKTTGKSFTAKTWHHIGAVQTSADNFAIYFDGELATSYAQTTNPFQGEFYAGGYTADSGTVPRYVACEIADIRVYDRAVSDVEVAALAVDPAVWESDDDVGVLAGAGAVDAVTAQDLTLGTLDLAAATLGQVHAVTAQDLTLGTPDLAAATLGQVHAVTAQDLTLGTPDLQAAILAEDGTDAVTAQDLTLGTPDLAAATLGQVHAVTAQDLTLGTPDLAAATLGQIVAVTAQDLTLGTPDLAAASLGQIVAVTAQGLVLGALVFELPSLGQSHVVTAQDLTLGTPDLAAATLGQVHVLIGQDLTLGTPELQAASLVFSDAGRVHTVAGLWDKVGTLSATFDAVHTVQGRLN